MIAESWQWPLPASRIKWPVGLAVSQRAAVSAMGTTLHEPFLQMAFLALPVIPHLRITDKGLVDVDKFELVA